MKCLGCGQDFVKDEMIHTQLPKRKLILCLDCAMKIKSEIARPFEKEEEYNLEAILEADDTLLGHFNRRL